MRNPFDQLAKQIGQEALGSSGATVAHDEINSQTQNAGLCHEPDPARQAERPRLGLLGLLESLAAEPCLLEIHSDDPQEGISSWLRLSKVRLALLRGARRVTAGAPLSLVSKLRFEAAPDWPPGVYLFGSDVLRVGLVVARELDRDTSTCLVRLIAARAPLAQAAKEIAAPPPTARERAVAEPHLQQVPGQAPSPDPDEQEFIMVMIKTWEEAKDEARAEGRVEGRLEGRVEALADGVLLAFRVRGIAVSEAARGRILAQRDIKLLERWYEKSIVASSVSDVIDDPS